RIGMPSVLLWTAMITVGCDSAAPDVNPAPRADAGTQKEASVDTGLDVVEAQAPDVEQDVVDDGGPMIRQVYQRDPFGRLDPTNLLHDGDFELSAADSMQYPWLGLTASNYVTGVDCRSGLRCIELSPSEYVAGVFVWPETAAVEVSFHGKLRSSQDCEKEAVGVVMMADAYGGELMIPAKTSEPVDGWCQYAAELSVPSNVGYHLWVLLLAARQQATGAVVFDDVTMVASSFRTGRQALSVPSLDDAWLKQARKKIQGWLPPNPPRKPLPIRNITAKKKLSPNAGI
ncbi:MAG TPA: hypothetical protein PLJ27_16400, partial [Polyangiaceae bacterium]|nr:hypothetical protein [Polyangiaceae bacterium]